jgi:hypothetical protein
MKPISEQAQMQRTQSEHLAPPCGLVVFRPPVRAQRPEDPDSSLLLAGLTRIRSQFRNQLADPRPYIPGIWDAEVSQSPSGVSSH